MTPQELADRKAAKNARRRAYNRQRKLSRYGAHNQGAMLSSQSSIDRFLDRGAYVPTQEEIVAGCEALRASWSEAERERRAVDPRLKTKHVEFNTQSVLGDFEKRLIKENEAYPR